MNNNRKGNFAGNLIWGLGILAVAAFLIIPATHVLFVRATDNFPYIMGFLKFAILSIMGEFLAVRLVSGRWQMIKGLVPKMIIWGTLGVAIVLMFAMYSKGVAGAVESGLLYAGSGHTKSVLTALYISVIMNLTFAPVFMAAHRITDTWIDAHFSGDNPGKNSGDNSGGQKMTIAGAISVIDWSGFLKFVVGKSIPLFWIPAHTITFLLPDTYKVIFAASLSIVLGLILSIAKLAALCEKA